MCPLAGAPGPDHALLGRGLAFGHVYTSDGTLVATAAAVRAR